MGNILSRNVLNYVIMYSSSQESDNFSIGILNALFKNDKVYLIFTYIDFFI